MRKKISAKQPAERGSFNKTFPFELVKSLQRQFEKARTEYPGLAHVLVLRSEAKGEEHLDEKTLKAEFDGDKKLGQAVGTFQDFLCYKRMNRGIFPFERAHLRPGARIVLPDPTPSSNVCQFWQYGSGLEYKSGRSWVHFLCQIRGEHWNKERATQRFLELAELTGGFLVEPTIVNYFGLSHEMQHLPYPVDRCLIALHECGFAKVCNPTLPENLFYMVTDLLLPITEHFLHSGRCAYLGAVPNVWLAWVMLCAEILNLAENRGEGQRDVLNIPQPSETGGGKISKEEANLRAGKRIKENPSINVRQLAKEIPCSVGLVSELPVWRALQEYKRKVFGGRKPKVIPLTKELETHLGSEDQQLQQLIADQKKDDKQTPRLYGRNHS